MIEYEQREFALKAVNNINSFEPNLSIKTAADNTIETSHNDLSEQYRMNVMVLEAQPLCEAKNKNDLYCKKFSTLSQNDERINYHRRI